MSRKTAIDGLKKSKVEQILGAKNFVWIKTKHDYSIICQTQNDEGSSKKKIEGLVCKKHNEGRRIEIGRFKNKKEWKDGILENWVGGVLDIGNDVTTFRQYGEDGQPTAEDLVFNEETQKWKKYESEYVDFVEEDDDTSIPRKLYHQVLEEQKKSAESLEQQKNVTQTSTESTQTNRSWNKNVHQNTEKKNYVNHLTSTEPNQNNSGIQLFIPTDVIKYVAFNVQISNLSRNGYSTEESNIDSPKISLDDTKQLGIQSVIDASKQNTHTTENVKEKFEHLDDDIDSFAVSSPDVQRTSTPKLTVKEQLSKKMGLIENNENPCLNDIERFEDFEDVIDSSQTPSDNNQRTSTPRKFLHENSGKLQVNLTKLLNTYLMIILTLALTFVLAFSVFPQIILIDYNSILSKKQKTN